MATKHQKFTLDIPKWLDSDQRAQLADDVIEYIKQRTEKGRDVDGDAFAPYSEAYMKSLTFKIGGKSKKVDLTLSGDMLAAIGVLSDKPGKIVIGFEDGSPENARADGNIRGTYGKRSGDPKKARPFLGISDDALDKLLSFYDPPPEDEDK